MSPWTLEEALALVRRLEPMLSAAGWHSGLTGSVLMRGSSAKDVDLIVYPRDSRAASADPESARAVLRVAGMRRDFTADQIRTLWRERGSKDVKDVEMWKDGGRRVDVFFLK